MEKCYFPSFSKSKDFPTNLIGRLLVVRYSSDSEVFSEELELFSSLNFSPPFNNYYSNFYK